MCIILCHAIACYILNIDWARARPGPAARYQKPGPGEKFGPGLKHGTINLHLKSIKSVSFILVSDWLKIFLG